MKNRATTDGRIALHLAFLVLAATMFLWSGRLHSSDGFAMYAVNDSLVRYGRYDIEQLHWMDIQQGTYGRGGWLYSRKGLGTSMAGFPLTVLGFVLPGLGPVQTSLLLAPLLTALSAALLYLAARRAFPHTPRAAAWLATVAWALGSVAWPYTKTFFSEPLVALATIGAFERLLALRDHPQSRRAAFGIGAWVGLGIVTRSAHAIVAPFFALTALFITWPRDLPPRDIVRRWRALPWGVWLSAAWPLMVALGLVLGYNWARFGNPFESGYLDFETFSANWLIGISGQLISPGRGLLWYVPWLVLLPLGVRAAWRRAPEGTGVALGVFAAYVLLYGKWYMWSGGSAWGPRFLVPTVPLLAWLSTPIAARRPRLLGLFVLLGIGVNAVACCGISTSTKHGSPIWALNRTRCQRFLKRSTPKSPTWCAWGCTPRSTLPGCRRRPSTRPPCSRQVWSACWRSPQPSPAWNAPDGKPSHSSGWSSPPHGGCSGKPTKPNRRITPRWRQLSNACRPRACASGKMAHPAPNSF
ncbi:hypothetical protein ARMA_1590 [Ardenticatena maritima]|uniref:Glycosyltransferase RgtA/B/C/D-like domain-containing protein n=1 Tax=Ardenticatena maritima TaxID=872965 RepID=A0A0M9UCS0_9CHLR|nr:hypothetical protein [Ardenticatena maritima]KPL87139.1 hypothetical protein SE16_11385 [Ardenticatena maritima]GAP63167.1 hypothetical protein ARMA_1590 [Ardenticatena maritima]